MQMLLLLNSDNRPFTVEQIHEAFQSESRFHEVRFNTPGGSAIEADYVDGQDSTIVRLDDDLETVSLSGQTDAALRAALILQRHLQGQLRIIDLDYAFDLVLSDFKDIDELRTAIDNAQAG
jgi:hypothetical protein